MTEEEFQAGLREAKRKIRALPPAQQAPLMKTLKEVMSRHAAIRQNCERARHGLDDLRILMKYIIFDFEATLREQGGANPPSSG